ncbi:MAG: hypothetical protein V4812_04720 [Pseudomonadota bacterium]
MSIDGLTLPKGAAQPAEKLLEAITQASTRAQVDRAAAKAEGFVLGLESTKTLKSQDAERLYVAFDAVAQQRLSELSS